MPGRGATSPVDERTSSTARATASPIAVPNPGVRDAIPSRSACRSVVGAVRTTGSSANATSPTLIRPGTRSTKEFDRPAGCFEPAGRHVRGVHRGGHVDDEHDGCAVGDRRQREPRAGDGDTEEGDRDEQQAGDEVAPPARAADDRGEHRQVRERDRCPWRLSLEPDVAGERRERHDERGEQERRAEGHRTLAQSARTCTSAGHQRPVSR